MNSFSTSVSPLLTLRKIYSSQEEMLYITRMRNIIQFQFEIEEDYEKLNDYPFQHDIACVLTERSKLEICLRYALSNVVKSHVLVHNYTPFRQWRTINFDNDIFQEGQNRDEPREEICKVTYEYATEERFLMPGFKTFLRFSFFKGWRLWNLLWRLFSATQLNNLQINKSVDYLNSMQKSTWRRVYANNNTYFSTSEADIAAYVKEQSQGKRQVNVFNGIIKRERGEFFNHFRVLETIASPYYYVLPHQNEEEYSQIDDTIDICLKYSIQFEPWELFRFESGLDLAVKIRHGKV
ncbi:uncharacterized protein NPIL_154141 [Nephila pilipes]|uniref:Uncharacterized protein n=1 Tax=Nephila pilipes TaxID=299642 RepID=A0A8X6MMB2_NEPPI|nr:uncharacterized protein NPIL_154141 [Nephila pilipes]